MNKATMGTTSAAIDPLNKFPHQSPDTLRDALGILPHWFLQALQDVEELTPRAVFNHMVRSYGMGDYEFDGGTVAADGTYQYPEDPELHPLLTITHDTLSVHFYQYAMFAIVDANETIVTRMD